MKILAFVIFCVFLTGCKSTPARPLALADLHLPCSAVHTEIDTHTANVTRLQTKQSKAISTRSYFVDGAKLVVQNPLVGIGALILAPLISERFTAEDEVELEKALAQQAYFNRVASNKKCPREKRSKRKSDFGDLIRAVDLLD